MNHAKENPPERRGVRLFNAADVMPIVIVILQMDDFAVIDFFFVDIKRVKRFSQRDAMA